MYQSNYSLPQNTNVVYDSTYPVAMDSNYVQTPEDERFIWGPLLVGGLAGGAIGYGLGQNNPRPCCGGGYPMPYPVPMYPQQPMYYPNQSMTSASIDYNNNYYM